MGDNNGAPQTTSGNPFDLIAYLLFKVRHSLEDVQEQDRAPRWVRISRARTAQGENDYIGRGVKEAVNGFAEALSYLVELALDVQEVLIQTDAAKAIIEVSADFIAAATDDEFVNGIRTLVNEPADGDNPLGGVGTAIEEIKSYLGYIPEPDDVLTVGHQLFRLLGIVQRELPLSGTGIDDSEIDSSTTSHIVRDASGKVRLMQWAFGGGTTTFGLGPKESPEEESVDLFRFGSRRVWKAAAANLPAQTLVQWGQNGAPEEMVSFYFDDRAEEDADKTLDVKEAHTLLDKLGYAQDGWDVEAFDDDLETALKQFQYINGIETSGRLDNPTINRLMNFDFDAKNILRAKPHDESLLPPDSELNRRSAGVFALVNPGADEYEDENIPLRTSPSGYPYYVAGALLPINGPAPAPAGGGWVVEAQSSQDERPDGSTGQRVRGFVGLRSRRPADPQMPDRQLDGGKWSEGEAASGELFFAARHVEPWIAGRSDSPGGDALFGGQQPADGSLSRMYQWVPLADILSEVGADEELYVTASVMQRSLYADRSRTTRLPDQGRIAIEFYQAAVYSDGPGSRREPGDVISRHQSDWYPKHVTPLPEIAPTEVARKRKWVLRGVGSVKVPVDQNPAALCVVLEGQYQSAFDIDAYFDDVRLTWEIRPT